MHKCYNYTKIKKGEPNLEKLKNCLDKWGHYIESIRNNLIENFTSVVMAHLGARAFEEIGGEVVQSVSFVVRKTKFNGYCGTYVRLTDYTNAKEKEIAFLCNKNKYCFNQNYFKKIPGSPIAYWTSEKFRETFDKFQKLGEIAEPKQGMTTSDNNRFLRLWTEVNYKKIGFNFGSTEETKTNKFKWYPYNKGGTLRKWYGNNDFLVNYENDGYELKMFHEELNKTNPGGRLKNQQYYFKESITWSFISTSTFGVRYVKKGFIFDVAGSSLFPANNIFYILGFLNTKITFELLKVLNPTMNFQTSNIGNLPIKFIEEDIQNRVSELVKNNIDISKQDWDPYEGSWDFMSHPLLRFKNNSNKIEEAFINWQQYTFYKFNQLKINEEELNKIFIETYELIHEITPEVDERDITISKADKERDIKSFISYAVGCIFGRYSLDEEGLIYAGGNYDHSRYSTIEPTIDNILPIADDVYFEEDIVTRFIDFVKVTFGEDTLEENLDYIAETLNKKPSETSRQTIRRYFLNEFYKDHVQIYKKRPIYWLFDSGKQDGFKALIYMHRYDPYTVARVRTDYLHKLQKKYDAEINRLDIVLESNVSQAEKTKARKKKEDLIKKMQECTVYDQAIAHVANQKIEIDLDDGVAVNYAKFQGVEIPQGEGKKPLKADLLAKI